MYSIYCDKTLLYDPRDEDLSITAGKMVLAGNSTGEFTFSLPPTHPWLKNIKKLKSVVQVYDDEKLLYEGRVIDSKSTLFNVVTYICEGDMAYLIDSIQRPKEYHDLTPESYLQDKIIQHNRQVGQEKQFVLGTVEIKSMNYDARQDNQYTNTLDIIMDKLVNSNGGYLRVRHENGTRYLDYLNSYGRTSDQVIRFGENILDLTEHISAADIITVLIPLGKASETAEGETGERLTIETVNDGKDYLEDEEAIALYGRIYGTYMWEDVTDPENLKRKGLEYLKQARNLSMTIELTAIDLHMADVDIDRICLGDMVRVVSPPHGLDEYMLVSKREYDLLNPSEDKIVLGDAITALTDKYISQQKSAQSAMAVVKSEAQSAQGSANQTNGKVEQIIEQLPLEYTRTQDFNVYKEEVAKKFEGYVTTEAFNELVERVDALGRSEA